MKNYVDLGSCKAGRYERYVFLDTEEMLAESVFTRYMVRGELEATLQKNDEDYLLYSVKIPKKHEERFRNAMEDLKTKMLICGHRDYETHGGELMEELRSMLREEIEATGTVELPMGGRARAVLD